MSNSLLDLVAKQRSADSLDSLAAWLEKKNSHRDSEKILALAGDVDAVRRAAETGRTTEVLEVVRHDIGEGGLDASAAALDEWTHGSIAAHMDDLDALMELADLEPDPSLFGAWLADQLAAAGASTAPGPTLASIHAVKGREWPHVIVHHASAGLMPHRLAGDSDEERRVFHVGLTRGAETVIVVAGNPASPYLAEMTEPGAPPPPPARRSSGPGKEGAGAGAVGVSKSPAKIAELMPAALGLVYRVGGHDYEVTEVTVTGVTARIGEGRATSPTAFGTVVSTPSGPALLGHPASAGAWERFRSWRAEKAKAIGKPTYIVFDDKTLKLIAAVLPASEVALMRISGIGPVKADTYGAEILAISEEIRQKDHD